MVELVAALRQPPEQLGVIIADDLEDLLLADTQFGASLEQMGGDRGAELTRGYLCFRA